jgi:hypothetical protein
MTNGVAVLQINVCNLGRHMDLLRASDVAGCDLASFLAAERDRPYPSQIAPGRVNQLSVLNNVNQLERAF